MIIKKCDVCAKEVDDIRELVDDYKVDNIAHVCPDCLKELDDLLLSSMKAQQIQRTSFIRRFIKNKLQKQH